MPLSFGTAISDRVNCGSGSSVDLLDPFTVMVWARATTAATGFAAFVQKGGAASGSRRISLVKSGASANVQVGADRATTDLSYISNSTPLVSNVPTFIAYTFNSANAANELVNIYTGNLFTPASEVTYGTRNDGTGAFQSDAAQDLYVGNLLAHDSALVGLIWWVQIVAKDLSLTEIRAQQFRPCVLPEISRLAMWLGSNGRGGEIDLSGNNNHGTVTGAIPTNDYLPRVMARRFA
jgi:hypothetical protein